MIEIDEITLAYLQIHNETLACKFSDFHKAVEKVLGRPVYTSEFADRSTVKEIGLYGTQLGEVAHSSVEGITAEVDAKFKEWCKK